MPLYCAVPLCNNKTGCHTFPKDLAIRLKWQVAIKRLEPGTNKLWEPGKWAAVCTKHFTEESYREAGYMGARRLLKKCAVPTLFEFNTPNVPKSADREERVAKRRKLFTASNTVDLGDIGNEVEVTAEAEGKDIPVPEPEMVLCQETQCELLNDSLTRLSVSQYEFNSEAINYYTGLDDFEHFKYVFDVLGPAVNHLSVKDCKIPAIDQFFLTLIKLRLAKDDKELSLMFHVSQNTVGSITLLWIKFMYYQFKEICIWPSKELVLDYMPKDFGKQFKSTRVILDATEVPITKPKNVIAQSSTFSTYKNKNTLKTMIGITPKGLVSYISESYGGSTSDRQIIERSPLATEKSQYFEKRDSIMSDRGIMVQDIFAPSDVAVNTPTMLQGKSQLEPETVVHDRRIASKRIHVERVIGLAKTYKIIKTPLPPSKVQLGSFIVYVCFMLTNFRRCIVGRKA